VTAIVSPFAIQSLPLQARFYKHAFRSGTANGSRVGRLLNRIAFYACETFADRPSYGHFAYGLGQSTTSIRFDARNRQYSAIYFDAFLPIYEPDVTATLLEFAPADGVFYDIGSNWGYFSLFLAATPGFKGEIHAFEPWPPTYEDLTSMVGQAGLDGVITTHRKAVGADPGAVLMQCGRHSGLAQIVEAAGAGQQESVEQVTLDSQELAPPDFIKLDVEGGEAAILRGAQRLLADHRPAIILEHTPGAPTATNLLIEQNYALYQPLPTLGSAAPRCLNLRGLSARQVQALAQRCNLLAFPGERRAELESYLVSP
jgi:FkbM family methyltransferase